MNLARKQDIDAVAGLMILWMVIGHLRQVCGYEWQSPNILYFFMPWFYYKAGMLWKDGDVRNVANRGGRKLLKPFVVYALVGQIILTICLLMENVVSLKPYLYSPVRSLILGGCVGGNTPLWFIPSLFVVQCVAAWLLSKKNWTCLWAVVSIVLGYGFYLIDFELMPTYIESAFGGLFFFCMGNWLKDWQYKWWVSVLCVVATIAVMWFGLSGFGVRGNGVERGNYFVGALASLVGCVGINGLMRWLQPYIRCYVLQYVGRNAMTIYVTHWIVLLLSMRLVATDLLHIYDRQMLLWIGGLSCIIVIPIYTKILKYVKTR